MSESTRKIEVSTGSKNGCLGCLVTILAIIGLWAVIFGVTIDGKHYGLSCDCHKGVVIDTPKKAEPAPSATTPALEPAK